MRERALHGRGQRGRRRAVVRAGRAEEELERLRGAEPHACALRRDVDVRVDNGVIRSLRELQGSNRERSGRLKGMLGRGGIQSGDTLYTVRTRAVGTSR